METKQIGIFLSENMRKKKKNERNRKINEIIMNEK
jgi:hypothetical protein